VALLRDGRLAAVGTHSELLATVPGYRAVLAATEATAPNQPTAHTVDEEVRA
jgi:ATP-binding cassette subfamily B protein